MSPRYRTLGCISRGGMAQVDLARVDGPAGFQKLVALKRLLPEWRRDRTVRRLFAEEARLGAQLSHPNLVETFDHGEIRGEPFIAVELVHGVDLMTLLRRLARLGRPLPLEHALTIVRAVAAGLHHAHEQRGFDGQPLGIVHRDVSPQNIMISFDGTTKLIDFGIATQTLGVARPHPREGCVRGKLSYMSPEQLLDGAIDRRADVFALSVVLWELTCGVKLFAGPSEMDVFRQIVVEDRLRPRSLHPDYPRALEHIVMRGLARQPAERLPTALALSLQLESFAESERLKLSERRLGELVRELFPGEAEAPPLPTEDYEEGVTQQIARPAGGTYVRATAAGLALLAAGMLAFVLS